jgi:Family of unknown function (DUF5677)
MAELWRPDSLRRIVVARKRARALQELTWSLFPRTYASAGVPGDWPLTGFAMLSRACGTLGSLMALIPERRSGDAAVLARTLFEEVVTFAWIAIDADTNAEAWVRWDRRQRIKADNDMQDVGAPALLDPDVLQAFEAVIAGGPMMPDDLTQRARDADAYWSQHVDAIMDDPAGERTFRGMYRYFYRGESQHAHAAVSSLEALIVKAAEPGKLHVLAVETDAGRLGPFTRAPMLYALCLLVAEAALDVRGMQAAADEIFARFGE